MMQLLIYITLYLNPFIQKDIDTTSFKSFDIKGQKYWIGDFNKVYLEENDSLIRLDKSLDSRMSISSYIFDHNDTIIKYGGYGFWSQRNFLYYFDFSSLEWEYYFSYGQKNIEGSFYGFQNKNDNRIVFYGGKTVNPKNRLEQIPSEEIVEFNFFTKVLRKIGVLKFDVQSKERLYQSMDFDLFVDDTYLYKINSLSNKVIKVNKPKVLSFVKQISFNEMDNVFILKKIEPKSSKLVTISLDDSFLKNPIEIINLYETPSNLIYILILPILLTIFSILMFFKLRNRKSIILDNDSLLYRNKKMTFKNQDIEFIRLLIEKDEINFDVVMSIYSNPQLTYAHNSRITNESMNQISISLKSIFNLNELPLKKIKSKIDRRQKVVVKSLGFEQLSKKIIVK